MRKEEWERALRENRNNVAALNGLGVCHLSSGDFTEAASLFERALTIEPNNAVLHRHLAIALQNIYRDREAATQYRRAIELAPNEANSYGDLGHLLLAHGDSPGATRCFRKAHELLPDSAWGMMHLARALIEERSLSEAADVLAKVSKMDPSSIEAPALLGHVLQQAGKFDEAEAVLRVAIEREPSNVSAYYNISFAKKIGVADREFVQTMVDLLHSGQVPESDRLYLHFALGKAYDDLGDYGKAMRHFDTANKLSLEQRMLTGRIFNREKYAARIQRIIDRFSAEFFSQRRAEGSESELPVFIVGMPRSGTTLVEQIISSHPFVGAGGEIGFWISKGENALDREPASALAGQYESYLSGIAATKTRVTDKMPQNYLVLGPVHTTFPRARIIHCKRAAVDTCLSLWVTLFRTPPDFAHDRGDMVFGYRQYERLMEHWRRVLSPEVFMEVQYEALIADRERTSREMIAFCGLEWNEACLRPDVNGRTVRTPSMWQARQPVYKSSVERWRNYEPWLGAFRELIS